MTFAYPLAWWALVVVLSVAGLAAWSAYAAAALPLAPGQRHVLSALRGLTLVLLVVFLLRPIVLDRAGTARDAVVPVLVDVSRSMGLADAGDGETRLARAGRLVERELLPALDGEFQVDVLTFGESLDERAAGGLEPTAERSDITGAIRAVRERYRGRTIAGIVLLSDGGDTSGEDAGSAVEPDVPVFALGVGSRRVERDREVASLTAGDAALEGAIVELTASVVTHGYGVEPFEVTVRENGRPLQVRTLAPQADGSPQRLLFQVTPPRDAAALYTVDITPDATELTADNNGRSALVSPPGRRRRLLLVEGAPGYEHSFLKRALAGDPGLEVDAVIRKGRNERGDQTYYVQAADTRAAALVGGYPASRAALFGYDAVVLANVEADTLTRDQLAMTADFVAERGGGLLVMGGRAFEHQTLLRTSLEDVLPVEVTDRSGFATRAAARDAGGAQHRVSLTADGERHPVMKLGVAVDETLRRWASAPPLASVAWLGGPRPGATVLAETVAAGGVVRPLLAIQRYGEGRAMAFSGEAAWRWKMELPAEDRLYETFWRQVARWLSTAAPDPVSVAVPASAMAGEAVHVTTTVRDAEFGPVTDAALSLTVTEPGGLARELPVMSTEGGAGRYGAEFRPARAGVYRLRAEARRGQTALGGSEVFLLVGGADREMADPRRNDEVLRRLAFATGGRLLDEPDLPAVATSLASRAPGRVPPAPRDLWHNAWSFLVIVALLSVEWALRRRWGLR